MSRGKISATKVGAIIRMRELGFTVTKISKLLGVSRVTVYDHINPNAYRDRLRRVTTSNREPKEHPKRCEVCKAGNTKLYFHIPDRKKPLLGLWLCNSCNVFCDICDDLGTPGILKKAIVYFGIVNQLLLGSRNKVSKLASK